MQDVHTPNTGIFFQKLFCNTSVVKTATLIAVIFRHKKLYLHISSCQIRGDGDSGRATTLDSSFGAWTLLSDASQLSIAEILILCNSIFVSVLK